MVPKTIFEKVAKGPQRGYEFVRRQVSPMSIDPLAGSVASTH